MGAFVLAIDQGTTNTKALALDSEGRIAARSSVPTPIAYPRPGWVEQSGDEIWRATSAAVDGCLAALPEPATIAAIGVSNQRETVLLWRRSTGETIGPCVTWQCRRSSDRIDALRTRAVEEAVDAVRFVPALAGLGAPYWKDRARASLTGMSLATSRADIARATLEAIALQIRDVFAAVERDLGVRLERLSADGGATQNDLLMQCQADPLGRPVRRLKVLELSAFGAGLLAGAVSGLMDEDRIEAALNRAGDQIEPRLDPATRQAKIGVWSAALEVVINRAETR